MRTLRIPVFMTTANLPGHVSIGGETTYMRWNNDDFHVPHRRKSLYRCRPPIPTSLLLPPRRHLFKVDIILLAAAEIGIAISAS